MYDYKTSLEKNGEIGVVDQVLHSIVYASGLPKLRLNEIVVFERGQIGLTISLSKEVSQILVLSHEGVKVGDKIARTGESFLLDISEDVLGKVLDSLGNPLNGVKFRAGDKRKVDIAPPLLKNRRLVVEPLETGVPLVDLLIPIGRGQRELIIGDRKTGKTQFFIKTIANQARRGNVCIYASIGKRISEIKEMLNAVEAMEANNNTVIVATSASDAPGLIYMTPYTAMAVAEYFRDRGRHVVLILDDLTNHAVYYREISLLARRFPGRSSYPGDIFYIHSKLLERAGNFPNGSITVFPVAESIMGDISGYIQTNLMSITDGHIFFDAELAALGRRPAINPFLSVTRVGQQAQSPLVRQLSHELSSFLVTLERLREFEHFGAELSEEIIQKLALGDRILEFFDQPRDVVPINMSVLVMAMIWIGSWKNQKKEDVKVKWGKMIDEYNTGGTFKKKIDDLISKTDTYNGLLNALRENNYGQENYY